MTNKKKDYTPTVNKADLIITSLKDKLGIRFDKDLSNMLGVKNYDLGNWRRRGSIPTDWYVRIKRDYLGELGDIHMGSELLNKNKNKKKGEEGMHSQAYENQIEINQLLRDKISYLEEKLKNQTTKSVTKTIITTSLWDSIDYDIQTFQTYDKKDFGYFKSYKIIRWQDFFAKLGYYGEEAKSMYQKHLDCNSLDYKNKKTDRAYDDNFLLHREATDEALYDRDTTNKFFRDEKSAQTVSKMTRFNLNYKHKNGGYIPAILHCLFDFDKLTGRSKIKFITNQ